MSRALAIATVAAATLVSLAAEGSGRTAPETVRASRTATLAFVRGGNGSSGVWLVQANGRRARALTRNTKGSDEDPAWSPDGAMLAFARSVDGGKRIRIYVVNADGRGVRAVSPKGGTFAGAPSWSADGRLLVFTGSGGVFGECHAHAFVVRPDGRGFRRLVPSEGDALDPVWSPNGKRLAIVRPDSHGRAWIFLGTAAGTQLRRLTLGAHPTWSPDGERLAFMRSSGGVTRIFVIGADGHGLHRLTKSSAFELSPAWSPDGASIAYWSTKGNEQTIYRARVSDGAGTRVTRPPAGFGDQDPSWRPR